MRLNTDGTLDTSFGNGGKLLMPVGSSTDDGRSVIQQADGKLVVVGYGYNGGNNDFSLVRLNADGTLDTSFGGTAANTLGGSASYTEGAAATVLDSSVALFDADLAGLNSGAGNYAGASITLARTGEANAQDVFSASGALSFSGSDVLLSGVAVGYSHQRGGHPGDQLQQQCHASPGQPDPVRHWLQQQLGYPTDQCAD